MYIDHFERVAAACPDRCAVAMGGTRITYRELNRRADRLAGRLVALGCAGETLVGVCLDRSIDLIIALHAILKAGAAFLPIDPQWPVERVKTIAAQSGTRVVLTSAEHAPVFAACDPAVVSIDPADATAVSDAARRPRRREDIDPSQLAYVIFTSGSTGVPKGVAISHESFDGYVRWALDYYAFARDGVSIVHTSIGADLTITSIFCPLLAGMTIVVLPEREGLDGLLRLLDEGHEKVSLLKLTPSHLRLMLAARPSPAPAWACDVLIAGGEPLLAGAVRGWRERAPDSRVFNEYGPTEATVGCCVFEATADATGSSDRAVPIGAAVEGATLHIDGELYVGGRCLARGYVNAPALTAARFLPDPEGRGGRLYRTGDQVHAAGESGALVYAGRTDRQVKIDGTRIELAEVEAILQQHPAVGAVAVVPARDAANAATLAAFISPIQPDGSGLDRSGLGAHVAARVVAAAVPREWYLTPALPLATSGKVDYDQLLRRRHTYVPLREAFLPPRTPTEELLALLWKTVLDCEEIGIDDSFFALDGNSMKSIQFVYRARQHGLPLSTRDLYQHQTIRRLAAVLATASPSSDAVMDVESRPFALIDTRDRERLPAGVVDAYPLASLQAGTVFESDHRAGSGTYHNVNSYHIECALDVPLLRRSIDLVTARHPILRTCYDYVTYRAPLQLVFADVAIPFHVEDISALSDAEQTRAVAAFIDQESRQAFDWTSPPLLRFFLHVRGPRRAQFTLSKHHSILDGWSAASLIAEIVKNYFALMDGQPAPYQRPLDTTYRDFVALEQQALRSAEHKAFWQQTLAGAPYHACQPWGTGTPRADGEHSSIATRPIPIDPALGAQLQALAKRTQTPLKSVLLAVHLRVLAQMTGRTRIVTGVVSHGRPDTGDADKAIGLFINTIPFHLKLQEGDTWIEWIRSVFAEEARVFPHQRYPMARIKKDLGGERLFDTIFYYTNFHVFRDFRRSDQLRFIDSAGFEETEIPFTAAFSLHPLASTISLALHFHIASFTDTQIAQVREWYTRALAGLAAAPEQRMLAQSIAGDADTRDPAVATAAVRARSAGPSRTVFDLCRAQADARPDAVALVFDDEQWTYGALIGRAAAWARTLRAQGVRDERIVCIHTRRSCDAILGMLAVNGAGGAFAVVDPDWPADRVREVLAQLQPALIITDAALASRVAEWPYPALNLSERPDHEAFAPARTALARPAAQALAYVIYTSGSTGQPKGVMVSQQNLYDSTRSRLEYYTGGYPRFLLLSRLTFDSAFAGIWGTLCGGGTLHLLESETAIDVGQVAHGLSAAGVSHSLMIPSLYRVLLPQLPPADSLALDAIILAGEEVTLDVLRSHRQRLPHVRVYNEYGPTEGTVWATVADVTPEGKDHVGADIGCAIAGVETRLLDSGLRRVSPGVAGELYLGGTGVARGYYRSPAATAVRFVPDPETGAVLYRTGDRARYAPEGTLQFLGRADNQVKVRGVRIEPEEIERVFHDCFDVCEAMVSLRDDGAGRKRLCLYYVAAAALPADRAIKATLAARLPAYMLPDDVEAVEELPKLWNNKLDRHGTPTLRAAADRHRPAARAQPSTDVERTLADMWREALGAASVDVHQSFFDAGGDSLLANQVVLRAERVFGTKLPIKDFYRCPTIATQAELLTQIGNRLGVDMERVAAIWNGIASPLEA